MNKLDGDIAVERLNSAVGAFLDIVTEPEGVMVPVPERGPQPSLAERVKQNLKPSTDKAQGFAEEAKRAAIEAWKAADAAGSAVQVDVFTESGTWTKPQGAKYIHLFIVGAGSGGYTGGRGEIGSNVQGGRGGNGGGVLDVFVRPTIFAQTTSVVVGKGGKGGIYGVSGGERGTDSRVADFTAAGAYTAGGNSLYAGGAGGASGTGAGAVGGSASGATGGGAGGGIENGQFRKGGTVCLSTLVKAGGYITFSGSGSVDGQAGYDTSGRNSAGNTPGMGAPGGASSVIGNGGRGGNAANGGGGGGGGAAYAPYAPGAGGNGGDGLVIITTFM